MSQEGREMERGKGDYNKATFRANEWP